MAWVRCCGSGIKAPTFPFDCLAETWTPSVPSGNITIPGSTNGLVYMCDTKSPVIDNNSLVLNVFAGGDNYRPYVKVWVSTDGSNWTQILSTMSNGSNTLKLYTISLSAYNGSQVFIRVQPINANPNSITTVFFETIKIV